MRSFALSIVAVALLASAPFVAAQAPPLPGATPTYTVVLQNTPAEFPALAANGSVQVPFQVVVELANVICAAAVQIPVTVTATAAGAPSNLVIAPEPSVINITISQGPHGAPPVGSPGGGTGDGVVKASVTGNITANASVAVTLSAVAAAPPSGPTGCSGAGTVSDATSEPVTVFANLTETPRPPEPEPVEEDTPGFTLVAAVGAVGIALLSRRRRA